MKCRRLLCCHTVSVIALFSTSVHSQDFAVESFVIASGGGVTADSSFAISGTIGQAEAGVMTGSSFELYGGFWSMRGDSTSSCPVPADLNCDGAVDVQDLLILLSSWGDCPKQGPCPADINNSGAVDVQDLLILLANWG